MDAEVLRTLLARLGWAAGHGHGRIRCRDARGRRAVLLVVPTRDGVVVIPSRPGPLVLRPLDAGCLRGALRSAALLPDPTARLDRSVLLDERFWTPAAS